MRHEWQVVALKKAVSGLDVSSQQECLPSSISQSADDVCKAVRPIFVRVDGILLVRRAGTAGELTDDGATLNGGLFIISLHYPVLRRSRKFQDDPAAIPLDPINFHDASMNNTSTGVVSRVEPHQMTTES